MSADELHLDPVWPFIARAYADCTAGASMSLPVAMTGLAIAASMSNLPAGLSARPSANEIVHLDYDYSRAAWGLTCLGYNDKQADKQFDRLFGKRKRRIDAWATETFGASAVEAATRQAFPDGFIMVGGCRIDETGAAVDPTPAFAAELKQIERRVRLSNMGR